MQPSSTIIIPAHNEAGYISACLRALLDQNDSAGAMHVIVAANACRDETVSICSAMADGFTQRGHVLRVLDLATPGKIAALNAAEEKLDPSIRIYLDADVICDPDIIGQICAALDTDEPRYGTGQLTILPAQSWITRAYASLWQRLPFFQGGAVGAGLFALNPAARARWDAFPDIISDDTFVRLNFSPAERIEVTARYHWPMVEGFTRLVKVRRRQDEGVDEVRALYPHLLANDHSESMSKGAVARLALRHPAAFAVYGAVSLAVKARRPDGDWVRGR